MEIFFSEQQQRLLGPLIDDGKSGGFVNSTSDFTSALMHRSSTPHLDPTPIAERVSIVASIPAQDNLMNPATPAVNFDHRIKKSTNLMRTYFMLNLNHVVLK